MLTMCFRVGLPDEDSRQGENANRDQDEPRTGKDGGGNSENLDAPDDVASGEDIEGKRRAMNLN